ncbi:MAG: hypothetical protein AAFQ84_13290, partial [Pseudomonadota bacterium]
MAALCGRSDQICRHRKRYGPAITRFQSEHNIEEVIDRFWVAIITIMASGLNGAHKESFLVR